jgi:hypothetical protein
MKNFKKLLTVLAIPLMGVGLAATANAQCGSLAAKLHKQAWHSGNPGATLIQTADDLDPIVGMWHVMFTAEGNPDGPPDGTPIDNALVVWHSDGTEIMASARPPQDGDICLGVWEKVGKSKYKLNHLAWLANDTTNAPSGIGNPAGPTRILEMITLSADGNSYTGTFTLRATDPAGKTTAHIVGTVSATRVTTNTTIEELL